MIQDDIHKTHALAGWLSWHFLCLPYFMLSIVGHSERLVQFKALDRNCLYLDNEVFLVQALIMQCNAAQA